MGNLSGFVKRVRDIMRNDAGINGDAQRIGDGGQIHALVAAAKAKTEKLHQKADD